MGQLESSVKSMPLNHFTQKNQKGCKREVSKGKTGTDLLAWGSFLFVFLTLYKLFLGIKVWLPN